MFGRRPPTRQGRASSGVHLRAATCDIYFDAALNTLRTERTEQKGGSMSEDRIPSTALQSDWGEAARRAARQGKPVQNGQQTAAAKTTRTVGVYERPARRTSLSLPVIVIMILATLISVILSVRFLF